MWAVGTHAAPKSPHCVQIWAQCSPGGALSPTAQLWGCGGGGGDCTRTPPRLLPAQSRERRADIVWQQEEEEGEEERKGPHGLGGGGGEGGEADMGGNREKMELFPQHPQFLTPISAASWGKIPAVPLGGVRVGGGQRVGGAQSTKRRGKQNLTRIMRKKGKALKAKGAEDGVGCAPFPPPLCVKQHQMRPKVRTAPGWALR